VEASINEQNGAALIEFPLSPSSRLLPMRMSTFSRLAVASIVVGSEGIKSPSMVGDDGKPRMPEYEFHCCTEMVFASTVLKQFITARGES
jgi:hypothetical protein